MSATLGPFAEGFASWRRILGSVPPEAQLKVFGNAVEDVASFIARGLDRAAAADELVDMASSIGFDDPDLVQEVIARAFTRADSEADSGVEWDRLDGKGERGAEHGGNGKATALEWWQEETVSGTDLQTRIFPPLRFVVPGLVPEGLSILAGKPKAKKSWLALDVAIAATADRFTLGEIKPDQGDVLYLALEDSLRRVQRRMTKLLGMQEWPSRLLIKTTWKRVDAGGLDGIKAWAKSVRHPTMVIVDTLERVRPMPSPSSKSTPYSLDYAALAGLQQVANELQISVIVVTHVRKQTADDVFDTISGTLGLTAAADTILVLGPKNGVMSLCVRGRDIEESEKAIHWSQNTCRWTITGDTPHDAPKSDARGRVLAALAAAGRAMSVDEIMKAAGFTSRAAADQMLSRMFREMDIERPSRGMYEAKTDGAVRSVSEASDRQIER